MAEGTPDQVRLQETVTQVSDTEYKWDLVFTNTSWDNGDPDSFYHKGVARLELAVPDADDIYGHVAPAKWTAVETTTLGGGPLVVWETADDFIMPGQSRTFVFYTEPRSFTWYPGLGFAPPSGGGSVEGAGMVPEKSPVDLDIEGLDDPTEHNAPGKRIHINDNFDENEIIAVTAKGYIVRQSDYLPDRNGQYHVKDGDPDVVNASLDLRPAGAIGSLTWTIDSHVKVYWKDSAEKWVPVSNQQQFTAPAQPIPLRIEGIDIGAGKVKVEFKVGMGPAESDEVAYTVYTGLKVTGDTGELVDRLLGQIQDASSWKVKKDAAGNVWRREFTDTSITPNLVWQGHVRAYLDPIFRSEKQTAVKAVNKAEVMVAKFETSELDPNDFAVAFAWNLRWGSAILVHELVEQYQGQVNGKSGGDAHADALLAEAKVYVDGGTRDMTSTVKSPTVTTWTFRYLNGTVVVEFDWDKTKATNIIGIRTP